MPSRDEMLDYLCSLVQAGEVTTPAEANAALEAEYGASLDFADVAFTLMGVGSRTRAPAGPGTQPVLRHRGRSFLVHTGTIGPAMHRFGGELAIEVRGLPRGADRPLHRLLTIDLSDPLLGVADAPFRYLPILYGFFYDGCCLNYEPEEDDRVRVLSLQGPPIADWPYEDYPVSFGVLPCRLSRREDLDGGEFDRLLWQGPLPPEGGDLVVIVPPSEAYGVSLWGDSGDAEVVQVVAQVDTEGWTVSVGNECS